MDFQKFYDNWAHEELAQHTKERLAVATWKSAAMMDVLPPSYEVASLLEVGCAEGHILNLVSKKLHAKNITGYELANPFVTAGKKLYPAISFVQGDFLESSIKDKVDLVIIADVLEHIPNPRDFLRKTRTTAHQFLIKMPLEWSLLDNIVLGILGKKTYPGATHAEGHLWEASYPSFVRFLKREGVTILASKLITPPVSLEYPSEEEQKKLLNVVRNTAHQKLPATVATILVGGHCVVWGEWKN